MSNIQLRIRNRGENPILIGGIDLQTADDSYTFLQMEYVPRKGEYISLQSSTMGNPIYFKVISILYVVKSVASGQNNSVNVYVEEVDIQEFNEV